jgi:superfamily I DNA/RNA helicase
MTMLKLSEQQRAAVEEPGNVFVTACPGSGKTRVLIQRIMDDLSKLESTKHRVIAVTFTNRAADEIKSRLDDSEIPLNQLWTGTIHSFSLDWILRPYACYSKQLRRGFRVADEYFTRNLINDLKRKHGLGFFDEVNMRFCRNGRSKPSSQNEKHLKDEYYQILKDGKLIDFDMVLYHAYRLVTKNKEISKTLGSIIRSICIDEYQDTQDLQYGILSEIVKSSSNFSEVFIVGDTNQAIYTSLGGVPKTQDEIMEEFGLDQITHHRLTGNYRSSQRIIDLSANFQNDEPIITSLTDFADEQGVITYSDQEYDQENLPEVIASMIQHHIDNGVRSNEICVLAPQWWQITALGRQLVTLLPEIEFDAPGLSLLHNQRENIWFKLSRLFLCEPEPRLYFTRLRWAGTVVKELEQILGRDFPEEYQSGRNFLRLTNSIVSTKNEGIPYLQDAFSKLTNKLGISIEDHPSLSEPMNNFFDQAYERLGDANLNIKSDVVSMKKMFKRPGGVVVTSCHGIKGDEYETVICFGLLKGYIPNWRQIINEPDVDEDIEAQKLLYVIVSRAKKNIHLISEYGRRTRRGDPYETNSNVANINFNYDNLENVIDIGLP